jgi:hypothetical protein
MRILIPNFPNFVMIVSIFFVGINPLECAIGNLEFYREVYKVWSMIVSILLHEKFIIIF